VAQRPNQCLWSLSVQALNTHVIEICTLFCLCVWCNGKHMHNFALQTVTVTDINYSSVIYMKTECIHLADDFFTKRKLLAEFVIDMKIWGPTFIYDGNHGCSSWHLNAWTSCIPINITRVAVTGVLSTMRESMVWFHRRKGKAGTNEGTYTVFIIWHCTGLI
jgi:hypothetical protein